MLNGLSLFRSSIYYHLCAGGPAPSTTRRHAIATTGADTGVDILVCYGAADWIHNRLLGATSAQDIPGYRRGGLVI